MRLLLVEDEPDLRRALARALADRQFVVDTAADGEEGLFQALEGRYDAIVLDVMLPHRDGWSVLAALREAGRPTPVLMLTARDEVRDRVRGLNAGADDYLPKPFALEELEARLLALIRRAGGQPAPVVEVGGIRVDLAGHRVFRDGVEVALTARESGILELLVRRRGRVVSRTEIAEAVFDNDDDLVSNTIDVHVGALRRKLGEGLIETRRGLGYLIQAPA
jgi:two-component system OmpR family response regulator